MRGGIAAGAKSAGGHYVPAFGCHQGLGVGVSWGMQIAFTAAFYQKCNNQGIVALSEEMMVAAKSIDGFDDALLRDDITQLDLEMPLGLHHGSSPYPYPNPFHEGGYPY